ncbi:MAG: folate-binding protein YgfZ [Burkholderiaceae bacterium]|nr:folate-binding protein YgfZ [Burkholderiaceae bacterium]
MEQASDLLQQMAAENGGTPDIATLRAGYVAPLAHLGLLALSGDDAIRFLHRMLTNDVERLRENEARLAGYCTPQGRLLATFLLWKTGGQTWLQMPLEILPNLHKRLQMFVLRDKVKIADTSGQHVRLGLGGQAVDKVLTTWFPLLPAQPYAKADNEHGTLIRVADAFDAPRYEWITSAEIAARVWPALSASLKPATKSAWNLAEIDAGIVQIAATTQELFVPQMVNYELVGGVNFKKGCYPGQEIVARTQYLGKNKRRVYAAWLDLPSDMQQTLAGADIYSAADPTQPCGKVVNAERDGDAHIRCLVSLRSDAQQAGEIRFGAADGPLLHFQPLPYALPDAAQDGSTPVPAGAKTH